MTKKEEKLAKLLRTKKEILKELKEGLKKIKKENVLEEVLEENERNLSCALKKLSLSKKSRAKDVFLTLQKKIEKEVDFFDKFSFEKIKKDVFSLFPKKKFFFLKKEKAKEILEKYPPPNILRYFKKKNLKELLKEKDLVDIFCALRFGETETFMNDVILREYKKLKKEDFEKREIEIRFLDESFFGLGKEFMGKKLHNLSHLKELGVIFLLPTEKLYKMEVFLLILHYLYEIEFFSSFFEKISQKKNFNEIFVKTIQGRLERKTKSSFSFKILLRYYGKLDPYHPELFLPHVNPEGLFWKKAQYKFFEYAKNIGKEDFLFWKDLDFVGEFFKEDGEEILLSFDLIDNLISFCKKTSLFEKYLYHQQEALWNRIFEKIVGEENFEKVLVKNLEKGEIRIL